MLAMRGGWLGVVLLMTGWAGAGPAHMAASAEGKPATGLIQDFPIDAKLFKTPREYFAKNVPGKIYRAYKARKNIFCAKGTPEEDLSHDGQQGALVYVPASYDGSKPFGLYLHYSPGARGIAPSREWQALLDKFELIYVSAHQTANSTPDLHRIGLGVDSVASVKQHYKIADERVFVGGLSGGGHMGMFTQMMFPEVFHGAVSHAAQSYLPTATTGGHFPGLQLGDIKSPPRNLRKWVVISGDKDKNYEEIKKTSKDWQHAHLLYKFIDVPGMAHANASAAALEEALTWIGAQPAGMAGK